MDEDDRPDWRPAVAALANPHVRRVFAQVVLGVETGLLGADLGRSRRRRALDTLLGAGLVREVDGRVVEEPDAFTRVLAGASRPRPTGPARFLDGRGRIDRYPADDGERRALLELVAEQVLGPEEVVTEKVLGERLSRFGPDTATLRRYLVEEELVERTRSGSQYARVR
ncbi:hypothetical protein SAMN05216184_104267 [Georgenia satyanarayanai]|uniref:DUF2087 domain-containing protein n=1 Tax=Georgenia satyanarayanai TaxID=860221 RepID=A0A2Y9A891_9MICO|nr:DUF2087 domain-containing protein [Georgenia satyanarayanai]PYG00325.1 hypothetical protein A8987_104267 [Georgenia satyanarayanai]SSA40711.1 hypothetical protein SAMN05216184_104267 [Georgenia satyanarayanai]